MLQLGIEKLVESPEIVKGKKIGLIANATSVAHDLTSSVDLLYDHPDINLVKLFGPQQGFWGEMQDNMIEWSSGKYPKYNLDLYSLYGKTRKPTPEMLDEIDVLIFDIQDVGTRVYTYIWTMVLAMTAAKEENKQFIVTDRPNPIRGDIVEGNISQREFSSFVSLYPLPLRHGMTTGEIAKYINSKFDIGCDLKIIELENWKRNSWFDETDLHWIMPSANLPTLDSATIYPGTVIFEGTNISEGRGTTRPFEFIGAPFIDGFDLARLLEEKNLDGVIFRPSIFIPTFNKYHGKNCGGIQIHIIDRNNFQPFECSVTILNLIKELYPEDFRWSDPPYEYTYNKPPIDMIMGSPDLRSVIDSGGDLNEYFSRKKSELKEFEKTRNKYLIYK